MGGSRNYPSTLYTKLGKATKGGLISFRHELNKRTFVRIVFTEANNRTRYPGITMREYAYLVSESLPLVVGLANRITL